MHSVSTETTITKTKTSKKSEFAQKIVVVSWAVTIIWISLSFILAFLDKDTNSDVTIALITESFGVTIAYFAYQAILKTSRNKHGIDSDGTPFKIKQKLSPILNMAEDIQNNEEGVG